MLIDSFEFRTQMITYCLRNEKWKNTQEELEIFSNEKKKKNAQMNIPFSTAQYILAMSGYVNSTEKMMCLNFDLSKTGSVL